MEDLERGFQIEAELLNSPGLSNEINQLRALRLNSQSATQNVNPSIHSQVFASLFFLSFRSFSRFIFILYFRLKNNTRSKFLDSWIQRKSIRRSLSASPSPQQVIAIIAATEKYCGKF